MDQPANRGQVTRLKKSFKNHKDASLILFSVSFGIVAIVYASKVDGLISAGRTQEAINASNTAKTWCWLSFGSVAIIFVIYFLFGIAGVLAII